MIRKIAVLLICIALGGCANSAQFLIGQKEIADVGAKIADENLVLATFSMCKAITVGAWVRAYGTDQAKAEAWRTLCAAPVTQTPAK